MSIDGRVLALIESFYEAAMDESRWPDALKQLSELMESEAATFWVMDGSQQPRLPTFSYVNLEPSFIQEYLDDMALLDPTVQYLVRHPHEPIVHDGLVISERDKDRNAYYDWHLRHTDLRFRMVGQICPAPAVQAGVALLRSPRTGRYESADIERFAVLHRHLRRALALGFRLGSLGTLQQCSTELLDRNPTAILLLDDQQRIVYANRAADVVHAAGDGLVLCDGVRLGSKRDNERLQAIIARTISNIALPDSGGTMQAQRPSGRRPYALFVSRMSAQYPRLSTLRPSVCILIVDPEAQTSISIERLQAVLGLTEAEARLASLLATGCELRDAAARLGITYGTARTRLAAVFHKTDTRRQGELIKLLLTILPTM